MTSAGKKMKNGMFLVHFLGVGKLGSRMHHNLGAQKIVDPRVMQKSPADLDRFGSNIKAWI